MGHDPADPWYVCCPYEPPAQGWDVVERCQGRPLQVRAQQAQDLPAGESGQLAVVEAEGAAPRRIHVLRRFDMVGDGRQPR